MSIIRNQEQKRASSNLIKSIETKQTHCNFLNGEIKEAFPLKSGKDGEPALTTSILLYIEVPIRAVEQEKTV
jgi:hypothetical protein